MPTSTHRRRTAASSSPDTTPGAPVRARPPVLLTTLDAVARSGSIRKAAEQLHIASTALNRRILQLEAELGTALFERLPSGVRLTAAGEIFMGYVRASLSHLDAATSQIEQLRGLVRGEVSVAAAESVTVDLLPRAIAAFQQRHPGVRFRVRSGGTESLVRALMDDEVELALAHDPPALDGLQALAALPQRLCAVLRRDHPLADRKGLRLSDCAGHPVAVGDESFRGRRLIDQALQSGRLKLNVALVASSVQTMTAYTREAGVVSFQFEVGLTKDARAGDLAIVPLTDRALANNRLVLAARKGRALPTAALRFAEALRERLREVGAQRPG
jgi:DNA-binding transcriptional LysR family regulator